MTHRICIVEDDDELAFLTEKYLINHGFDAYVIGDGLSAVELIPKQNPALVVLDIMLPGLGGMDVCRRLRPDYRGAILMLTALDDDLDQILGLELGADDYLSKPVKPRLLLTRIRTLLRRIDAADVDGALAGKDSLKLIPPSIEVGVLKISTAQREAFINKEPLKLTNSEYDLLVLLAQHAGNVVDRTTILQTLRGFDYDGFDRSIDRRVSRLREKLKQAHSGDFIKTLRGKGYQLCVPQQ